MNITNATQPGQQPPATQSYKYYSEQELLNCLKGEHMTVKAVLCLIESHFEKEKKNNGADTIRCRPHQADCLPRAKDTPKARKKTP